MGSRINCIFLISLGITVWLGYVPATLYGQHEPMYSQYIFNNSVINPAQAGANRDNQAGMLIRSQWLGMDGGPRTQTAFANFKLPRQLGMAVGIYQDRLGPEVSLRIQGDLAYHAVLTDQWRLAGGLRLLFSNIRVALTDLPNVDQGDPSLNEDIKTGLLLNVGAGLLAYTPSTFVGLAMPRVFHGDAKILTSQIGNIPPDIDLLKKLSQHLFVYAGTSIDLSYEIMFMPSALVKFSRGNPSQVDINPIFGYRDLLDFGPLIRTNFISKNNYMDALGFLVGLRFLSNWYFGYTYEYPLTNLSVVTRQTHEISLRFMFHSKHQMRIGSPRYFL